MKLLIINLLISVLLFHYVRKDMKACDKRGGMYAYAACLDPKTMMTLKR